MADALSAITASHIVPNFCTRAIHDKEMKLAEEKECDTARTRGIRHLRECLGTFLLAKIILDAAIGAG